MVCLCRRVLVQLCHQLILRSSFFAFELKRCSTAVARGGTGWGGAAVPLDQLSQTNQQVCGLRIFISQRICFLSAQLF